VAGTGGYGEELSGSINAGNFLTSCKVYWLASQEGLCSMEGVSKFATKLQGKLDKTKKQRNCFVSAMMNTNTNYFVSTINGHQLYIHTLPWNTPCSGGCC
jgi:hypothetical protein